MSAVDRVDKPCSGAESCVPPQVVNAYAEDVKRIKEHEEIARVVERARAQLDEEQAEAYNRALFLKSLGEMVDKLSLPVGVSIAADMINVVKQADVEEEKIDVFFQNSTNSKLGQVLRRIKGFRSIEIVDGLDGISGAVFLSILDTVPATPERKILLRDALFFRDSTQPAVRFFETLCAEQIVHRLETNCVACKRQ